MGIDLGSTGQEDVTLRGPKSQRRPQPARLFLEVGNCGIGQFHRGAIEPGDDAIFPSGQLPGKCLFQEDGESAWIQKGHRAPMEVRGKRCLVYTYDFVFGLDRRVMGWHLWLTFEITGRAPQARDPVE